MKIIFFISMAASVSAALGQSNQSIFDLKEPKYSMEKAYLYGLSDVEGAGDILEKGHLNKTVVDTIGVTLTGAQVKKIVTVATGNNDAEVDEQAECFLPHHGVVFYDEKNRPLASVTICFDCRRMKFHPKIVDPEKGITILKEVILELGLPVFDNFEEYLELGKKIRK
ncbi:MAG: hypothetical protein ACKODM_10910 [Cytophagales bacterium]